MHLCLCPILNFISVVIGNELTDEDGVSVVINRHIQYILHTGFNQELNAIGREYDAISYGHARFFNEYP